MVGAGIAGAGTQEAREEGAESQVKMRWLQSDKSQDEPPLGSLSPAMLGTWVPGYSSSRNCMLAGEPLSRCFKLRLTYSWGGVPRPCYLSW